MTIDASAVARVVGVTTEFNNLRRRGIFLLPQRIAVVGQGSTASTYPTTKAQYTSASAVGTAYGFGSPLHLVAKQLLPANGDGVGTIPVTFYPLVDDASGVAATGDITPTGTATRTFTAQIKINNILSDAFVVTSGEAGTDLEDRITDAINAVIDMPVTAVADGVGNKSDLTSKWEGTSANQIFVEYVGPTDAGITFGITQPTGGAINPDVDDALNIVGDVWETLVINCMESTDTASLDKLQTWNEGRWLPTVRMPAIVFNGTDEETVATAITVPDARKTDRTNSQLVNPGSNDLGFVIAARQVARIATQANNNPPVDYGSLRATGLNVADDDKHWTYAQRDQAVKGGSSTVKIKDGVVNLSDTITYHHPTGEPVPAYRYVVDIIKIQNIIYNVGLIFDTPQWDGAPLIPDNQPTNNPAARKPKDAKIAVNNMIDALGLRAIISDPETAKTNTTAVIDSGNPKRLNVEIKVQLSGNANIIDSILQFGFFFGQPEIIQ